MHNLNEFPVQVRFPIAWGEMDAFYHVNNVNYFHYFQNALTKYFDELGIFELKAKYGIGPVMAESKCKYIQSLTYPDNITVGARVRSIGQTSIVMEYLLVSEKLGASAVGEAILVMYNFNTAQKVSVPEEVKASIKKMESGMLDNI